MLPLLAPLLLSLPLIAAWRPTDRTCGGTTICLTSFKWCEESGEKECYYPPNVYSQSANAGPDPALMWGTEYDISWKGIRWDSGTVKVQWIFIGDGENKTVVWETELAALNNNIKFIPSPSMFLPTTSPLPKSNLTFDAAQGRAARQSQIRIRQGEDSSTIEDFSDPFIVLPAVTRAIVDTAVDAERRTWKRRMVAGLIVGILGTAGVASVGTWWLIRRCIVRRRAAVMVRKVVD